MDILVKLIATVVILCIGGGLPMAFIGLARDNHRMADRGMAIATVGITIMIVGLALGLLIGMWF